MDTSLVEPTDRAAVRPAGVAVLVVAAVLASGVPAALVEARGPRIAVGVGITVVVVGLAGAVRNRGVRESLLALGALSVFGWVTAALFAAPGPAGWLGAAPIPVAFLVVNAMKLVSVAVLLVLAVRLGWSSRAFLVRVGDPGAPALPFVRWPVAAVAISVAVGVLFVLPLPATAADHVGELLAWLPVMLAGAVVNAVAEELLYRHALIGTMRRVIGVRPALVLSSAVFGLAHLTGTPGGVVGVLATAVYGAVCAAAMLQTRGMVWNTAIHVAGDLAAVGSLFLAVQAG